MTKENHHEKLAAVEILRSLAILGVVSIHSVQITKLLSQYHGTSYIFEMLDFGRYGPQLFFAISGYLICRIYDGKELTFRNYTLKRIARIYPLWLAFLMIYLVKSIALNEGDLHTSIGQPILPGIEFQEINYFHIVLLSFTFLLFCVAPLWNQVIPGGWSIQSEVWHYVTFPFLVKFSVTKLLVLCGFMNLIARIISNLDKSKSSALELFAFESFLRLSYPSTVSFFVLGMCASRIQKNKRWIFSWANLTTMIFFVFTLSIAPAPFGRNTEALYFIGTSVFVSLYLVRIKVLQGIFLHISRYSYFIYFVHFLILDLIVFLSRKYEVEVTSNSLFVSLILIFFITLITSMLLGRYSWKYFESPIIEGARRFGERT